MPIFDYICKDCGLKQEIILRSTDKPMCEGCGSTDMEKQFPNSISFRMGFAWPSQSVAKVLDHKRVI